MNAPQDDTPKVRAANWEGDGFVVVVNDKPIGWTLPQQEAERIATWLQGAHRDLVKALTNGKAGH